MKKFWAQLMDDETMALRVGRALLVLSGTWLMAYGEGTPHLYAAGSGLMALGVFIGAGQMNPTSKP